MNRKFQILTVILIAVLVAAMVPFALATEPHEHKWDSGVVTKEPDCLNKGVRTFTCTICNETDPRPIDELGHHWTEWVITKKPTCEHTGAKERSCDRPNCPLPVAQRTEPGIVNPLGHNWSDWRDDPSDPPSCLTPGKIIRTCPNIGCEKEGVERATGVAKGHRYGPWLTQTAPTCSKEGTEVRTCPYCAAATEGHTQERKVPSYGGSTQSQGHQWGAWSEPKNDEANGKHTQWKEKKCELCGRIEKQSMAPTKHVARVSKSKDGKNSYTWFLRTKASMQGPGRAVQYCAICGKVMKSKEIKFEGGRYNIPVTGFGPKAASVNASLAGSNDRLIPVDFTNTEPQVFGLVTNDGVLVGQIHLRVMDDTVSISYTMNDMETVVSQAVFFLYSDATSLTAADLTDMTKAHQFGETVPLNGATFGVLAARLVVNYNSENAANRPFSESGLYLDGVTNNATILQEMTANLLGQ